MGIDLCLEKTQLGTYFFLFKIFKLNLCLRFIFQKTKAQ